MGALECLDGTAETPEGKGKQLDIGMGEGREKSKREGRN